jgi:hypothetical protein
MFETLLLPQSLPFSVALAVVAGLFALEILSLILGGSILGVGGSDADIDMDADFDLSADFDPDMDLDIETPDLDLEGPEGVEGPIGLLGWMGLRDVPFLIWLVSFLTLFGLSGLIVQSTAAALIGVPLLPGLAVVIAMLPALAVTRVITNWVALLMPRTETSAMRVRHFGGHRGVITQGTAKRGKPAEARIRDRHGNTHYLRVEPLEDDAEFPQGSDVVIIRKRGDRFFVL